MARVLLKAVAVVSSLAFAGGVIWYRITQVNEALDIAVAASGGSSPHVTEPRPATLLSDSKYALLVPASEVIRPPESGVPSTLPVVQIKPIPLPEIPLPPLNDPQRMLSPSSKSGGAIVTDTDAKIRRIVEIIRVLEAAKATQPAAATQPATISATSPATAPDAGFQEPSGG